MYTSPMFAQRDIEFTTNYFAMNDYTGHGHTSPLKATSTTAKLKKSLKRKMTNNY